MYALRSLVAPLCVAALMFPALAAHASPTCDVRASNSCPVPGEVVTFVKDCPRGSGKHACPQIASPPPAELLCSSAQGTVVCEAWPQSDELTYRYVWSVLNGVEPNYVVSEFSPYLYGNCSGRTGKVTVTVIAPNGQSTYVQSLFTCERGQ